MTLPSRSQIILSKINEFYQINSFDTHEKIKCAFQQLIYQWSEIFEAADDATDDELFYLNVSRAFLTRRFRFTLFKDCFDGHSFTQDIYRTGLNLLINHIDIFTKKYSSSMKTFLISNIILIMEILSHITSFLWYSDIELFHENVYQLLLAMREYVDEDMFHDNLTDGILSFIWNTSDNTSFVPLFLKANYAKSIVEWIQNRQTKFRDDKHYALINILLNFLRHDDGIEQLNHFHALDIIEQIEINSNISLQLDMIRVLLTDINKIKLESMEFLDELIQLIIDAGTNEKYCHDGSHVCEPLTVLTKLFFNQKILSDILSKITTKSEVIIELFISLLSKFYPKLSSNNDPSANFTCVLILNIFSCMSFHQEYYQIIYNNEQLMNIIKNAANNENIFLATFMPRTMKNIQQAAIEILKNQPVDSI